MTSAINFDDEPTVVVISVKKEKFLKTVTRLEQDFILRINQTAIAVPHTVFIAAEKQMEDKALVRLVSNSTQFSPVEEIFRHWGGSRNKTPTAGLNELVKEVVQAAIDKSKNGSKEG